MLELCLHRGCRQRPVLLTASAALSCAALSCAALTACQSDSGVQSVTQALSPAPGAATGKVLVDGSSTVLPVSKALADAFGKQNPGVQVTVNVSGTGGGFEKLCSGRIDVAGASRPINAAESERCKAQKVEYIELPIAFDSLSVVASKKNEFLQCLTLAELRALWEPAAEGKLTSWSQVRAGFPEQKLALFGPDGKSGTYDYFTLATVGTEGSSRKDYTASEDDEVIERGVAGDTAALGFFGYSYYLAHQDQLKAVAVDGGKGCVAPSPESVRDGSYQPLARPIFIYVNRVAAARPDVRAFARFFLAPESRPVIEQIGYVPLPPEGQTAELARLESGVTGSALGAHGSVLGVRVDRFSMEEERVQSALVQ